MSDAAAGRKCEESRCQPDREGWCRVHPLCQLNKPMVKALHTDHAAALAEVEDEFEEVRDDNAELRRQLAKVEAERDRLWCEALSTTLLIPDLNKVLVKFDELRPDKSRAAEEGGHAETNAKIRKFREAGKCYCSMIPADRACSVCATLPNPRAPKEPADE